MTFRAYADPDLFLTAPDFPKINEKDYVPHVKEAIEIARRRIADVKSNPEEPTFDNTIIALEHADDELKKVSSVFYALLGAESTDTMQNMAQEIGPLISAFANDVGLDPDIFQRIDTLWQKRDSLDLSHEEMVVLENSWTGLVRNGAKLDDVGKQELRKIDEELSKLSPKFSDNALQATKSFELVITREDDLKGLPDNAIAAAKEAAEKKNIANGWLFTLDVPSYVPFLTYADNRELREKIWRASASRSFGGEHDNSHIVKEIVTLRHKRAQLLGYTSHADYILERRMAENPDTVQAFLDRLEKVARPRAQSELEMIQDFAAEKGFNDSLKPWDLAYWSEKLKKDKFDFDAESLRPYLPIDSVINGLFDHAGKLFGVKLTQLDDIPVYADDVRTYRVEDADGTLRGLLYADFYPRAGKRQGAWETEFRTRGMDDQKHVELPIVNIVMNFTKPTKDTPSLLTLDEAETMFHEFGHALHSLLTDVDHGSISGTAVYWDFVELPSQLMENWLGEAETLNSFARHYQTGEPIPSEMIQRMKDAQNFMKGWQMMRQVSLCKLDMAWHSMPEPGKIGDVLSFERQTTDQFALLPYEDGCVSTSFSHLFSGGYSAGYYSYLWAQVLDADAFEAFVEKGLYDQETGQRLRKEIYAKGGSDHPMVLYKNFRGREPDPDALLRRDGLIGNAAYTTSKQQDDDDACARKSMPKVAQLVP